jgi:hypothetical protein
MNRKNRTNRTNDVFSIISYLENTHAYYSVCVRSKDSRRAELKKGGPAEIASK